MLGWAGERSVKDRSLARGSKEKGWCIGNVHEGPVIAVVIIQGGDGIMRGEDGPRCFGEGIRLL
jgi:hypothetical protein